MGVSSDNLWLSVGATDSRSAALKSLKQRRDYGAQPTAACISKSTERALREEGRVQQQPSRAASGNELDALDWEEEEDWGNEMPAAEHAWEPVGLVRHLGRPPQDLNPGSTRHSHQRQQQEQAQAQPAVKPLCAHLAKSHHSPWQTSAAQQQKEASIPLGPHHNSVPSDNTAADRTVLYSNARHQDVADDAMHLPGRGQTLWQLPAQSSPPDTGSAGCHVKVTALHRTGAGAESQPAMSTQSVIITEQSDYELALRLQAQEHAMHRQHSRPVASGRMGVTQKQRQTSGTLHAFFKQA